MRKLFTLACCAFLALFCLYGFLASDEATGARRLAWKTFYALVGSGLLALGVWRLRRP